MSEENLRDLLERASDVESRDLVGSAEREARRRTSRSRLGAVGAVAAATALVVGGSVLAGHDSEPRREEPAGETSSAPPSPSSSESGAVNTDADKIAQPLWDPFTVVDAPRTVTTLPQDLVPPQSPPSVLDEPMEDVVVAWPQDGHDVRLLASDGTWRTLPDSAPEVTQPVPGEHGPWTRLRYPVPSPNGRLVAVSQHDGVRVVDVTTGDQVLHPWPKRLASPYDTFHHVRWLGEDLLVLHVLGTYVMAPDGSFEPWAVDLDLTGALSTTPDGTAYVHDFERRTLTTFVDGTRTNRVDFPWWGERLAAGHGLVAFVGGTSSGWPRNGPMVVDPTTGEVLAYAPIKDPNAVYSDNGYLSPLGFLDQDTVLLEVGPMNFRTMNEGDERWHLVAWDFESGDFHLLSSGDTAMRDIAVVTDLVPLGQP